MSDRHNKEFSTPKALKYFCVKCDHPDLDHDYYVLFSSVTSLLSKISVDHNNRLFLHILCTPGHCQAECQQKTSSLV